MVRLELKRRLLNTLEAFEGHMSRQLLNVLETEGYDATTAKEIVKLAEEKPDDVAREFLEEMIDNRALITRYLNSRSRPKPLSLSRKESPEPRKRPTPQPIPQNVPSSPRTPQSTSSMPKKARIPGQPYARPFVQPGSAIHQQILSEKAADKPKPSKEATTQFKIESIKDLDAAIKRLELDDPTRRPCTCMGSRHGLCELAPNCLNCGRIVCAKEGLGRCLGCNAMLVDNDTVAGIFGVLQNERDEIVATMGKRALKSANIDPGLAKDSSVQENFSKAHSNLERLLGYQDSSAVRTKIIDQAADFDTPDMGTNIWASPLEQARQLKEQQRRLRRSEETRKMRRGQGRKVISIDIRGNKVIQTAEDAYEEYDDDDEEDEQQKAEAPETRDSHKPEAFFDVSKYGIKFVKPVVKGDAESTKSALSNARSDKVARDDDEVLAW